MSEQLKADFARAQKFVKAGQYAQAITILKPHKDHPRIAALITDLETRRKPSTNGIVTTILWLIAIVAVAIITGLVSYTFGVRQTKEEYEIPSSFLDTFVDVCTANTDISVSDCAELIRSHWRYYQSEVLDCYGLIDDASATVDQFLQCIAHVSD